MEGCARLGYERVVLEEIQPSLDGIVEVAGIAGLGIVLRTGLVMADSCQMRQRLTSGDGRVFLGKRRAKLLHGRIKIEFAALPKLQGRGGGNGLGDRGQPVESVRGGGGEVLQISHAESARPFELFVLDHRDRNSRDAARSHELRHGVFDLGLFLGSKPGLLAEQSRGQKEDADRERDEELVISRAVHRHLGSGNGRVYSRDQRRGRFWVKNARSRQAAQRPSERRMATRTLH